MAALFCWLSCVRHSGGEFVRFVSCMQFRVCGIRSLSSRGFFRVRERTCVRLWVGSSVTQYAPASPLSLSLSLQLFIHTTTGRRSNCVCVCVYVAFSLA
jgi:hypothetical protein